MKLLHIPASLDMEPRVFDTDDYPSTYDAIVEGVGGYIEAVFLPASHTILPSQTMYINEEGKLNGLPRNHRATALTRGILSPSDFVVGDVVIAGPPDSEGEDTECQFGPEVLS